MTSMTRDALNNLLTSRIDYAFDRVAEKIEYLTACKQQGKIKDEIDKLFKRFSEDEQTVIQQFEEGKTQKGTFEIQEVYLQGLRDGFKIIAFLGDFQSEVQQV